MSTTALPPATDVELDMGALMRSLLRASPFILVFGGVVAAGTFYGLSRIAPTYTSETTILIETGESSLTRSSASGGEASAPTLDKEAITSQVQLIRSRDLARAVATKLDLATRPEYDKAVTGSSLLNDVLARFGLAKSPSSSSVEERILAKYYEDLNVYTVKDSRVIAIDFSSTSPQLAADAANAIAAEYIALQRAAKRDTTADATAWLESEIATLRTKVTEAEGAVEAFRAKNDLFTSGGTTPTTLSGQQLSDLNAELARIRAAKADAEAKAAQIRASLKAGIVPNISEVLNSPLIQRLIEQQVALKAQIAQFSATLLSGHPRMRELSAQLADLDAQVAREAQKIVAALEAEAQLALGRESEIQQSLDKLKVTAAGANDAEVQLRALEREAAAQRDLLDTYLRRYREALARQNGDYLPADARVISRAAVPITPSFPKVLPMTAAATAAALILAVLFVVVRQLTTGRALRQVTYVEPPIPAVPDAVPVDAHLRWADNHGVRRMMPGEPSLALPINREAEKSLATIADQIVSDDKRRILVTLAEGSEEEGRPLAAVALARALARVDRRVVLVDLRGDEANSETMGAGKDLPGFTDLFAGDASFAQVIFRDRRSRAHLIPAGRRPIAPEELAGERFDTVLDALDHTYDHLVIDARDNVIDLLGRKADVAMVATEYSAADPRTIRAFDRITAVSSAAILLLIVDTTAEPRTDLAVADDDRAAATGAAA